MPFLDRFGQIMPETPRVVTVAQHWGPPLWLRLHTGARTAATPAERVALVAEITAAVPPQCGCQNHWQTLLAQHPPQTGPGSEFFRWTWQMHNHVRRAKGHPELPLAAAEALYPPE